MIEDLDPDYPIRVTTEEASRLLGITPDLIYQWKRRGHIKPIGKDNHGRHLYALDVLSARVKITGGRRRSA